MIFTNMFRRTLLASGLVIVASVAVAQTPRILWQYQGTPGQWQPIDFSPSGASIVYGSQGNFQTFNVGTGAVLNTLGNAQTYYLSGLTFSPDSSRIYAASFDLTLQTWSAQGEILQTSWQNQWSNAAVSPNGGQLAVGFPGGGAVKLLNENNHALIGSFAGHQGAVYWIAYSNDGRYLATTGADGRLIVRRTGSMTVVWSFQAHAGPARSLAFSPSGSRIVTGGNDGFARVWDLRSGQMVAQLPHAGMVSSVAWSPNGKGIATASTDPAVRMFRAGTFAPVVTYTGAMGEGPVKVAFSRDSSFFAYSRRDGMLVMAKNPIR